MSESLNVQLSGGRSYVIHIGSNLIQTATLWQQLLEDSHCAIVTNTTIEGIWSAKLKDHLPSQATTVVIPDGEQFKTLSTYQQVIDEFIQAKLDRYSRVIALGGGVVGDITGFACATYLRGIDYLQVPTTLLAQVDAAVGGKTAVNHEQGKNLIGAFYQPLSVVADVDTLATLPDRVFKEGLAEVVKHGVIADADHFAWLEANVDVILAKDRSKLTQLIKRNCEIKASVVEQDETEKGTRAILNFGHTFAHGIENLQGYGTYLHGEAVSLGMAMASNLAVNLGLLEHATKQRVMDLLRRFGLPITHSNFSPDVLIRAMATDKKAKKGRLRFVLSTAIGTAQVFDGVATKEVVAAIDATR